MSKKVTKEQIPEEPSSESSDTLESLSTEEFNEKYLDLDELLFHLITLRKFKRNAEDWVRDLNQLVENKVGMKEYHPVTNSLIKHYLTDLTVFSEKIMKAVKRQKKLQDVKRNKNCKE